MSEITSEILFVLPRILEGFVALSVDINVSDLTFLFSALIKFNVPKILFSMATLIFFPTYLNVYKQQHDKLYLFYIDLLCPLII